MATGRLGGGNWRGGAFLGEETRCLEGEALEGGFEGEALEGGREGACDLTGRVATTEADWVGGLVGVGMLVVEWKLSGESMLLLPARVEWELVGTTKWLLPVVALLLVVVLSRRLQLVEMGGGLLEELVVLLLRLWVFFVLDGSFRSPCDGDGKSAGSPCSCGSWSGALGAGWLAWGRLGEGTMMNPPVAVIFQPLNIKAQKGAQWIRHH